VKSARYPSRCGKDRKKPQRLIWINDLSDRTRQTRHVWFTRFASFLTDDTVLQIPDLGNGWRRAVRQLQAFSGTMRQKTKETKMLVKEVMTPQAEWIGPDTPLVDAAKKMRDMDVGSLPVGENDRVIGMVTDRDIACRGVAENMTPAEAQVRSVMTKDIVWCFDDLDIADAAHMMEDRKIRRLTVMNHDKRMVGILSVDDLSQRASHALSGKVIEQVSRH
jgi:CBS domain-containing protein